MKTKDGFNFIKRLQKRLGKDLVYSLTLDGDDFYINVSTYKSLKRKFKDDKLHPCKLENKDLEKHEFILIEELKNIYENLLEKKINE